MTEPASDSIAPLALRPDSPAWAVASDPRLLLYAPFRALILQVAHPVVGAGVAEHSNYMEEPWQRLVGTLDLFWGAVYGGAQAAGIAAHLRQMHRGIRGVQPNGRPYHAWNPEAWTWVHATLVETVITMRELIAGPMPAARRQRIYEDMLEVGHLYRVREGDMPSTWIEFGDYFDDMVENRLEDNQVVRNLVGMLDGAPPPPGFRLSATAWRIATRPLAHLVKGATIGLLPPVLRRRLGLRFTRAQELELRAQIAVWRATSPLIPARLLVGGPTYLALRRRFGTPLFGLGVPGGAAPRPGGPRAAEQAA